MINQNQSHHRFAHWYEARQQAGIMAAFDTHSCRLTLLVHCWLFLRNTARRFDCHPKDDRFTAADATEHAAMTVGHRADALALGNEGIVVGTTPAGGDRKASPILKGSDSRQ